jgi:hypothetical protein
MNWKNLLRLLYVVAAAAPFLSLYLAHCLTAQEGHLPTGFILYDMPYYSANGREIFERGNGITYPNPYDATPDAAPIYFHWFIWLLGFGIQFLMLDPGVWFVFLGVGGALLCSWFTLRIVETILPDPRFRIPLFFLVMWGGGVLALGAITTNVAYGQDLLDRPLRFDPFDGWWCLNWGRNLIYATEATYHAFAALAILAVLKKRWAWALAGGTIVAMTHPFSGFQLLAILTAWFGVLAVVQRTRPMVLYFLASCLVMALFLGYYKVFLDLFPAHRNIHRVWSLQWTLSTPAICLAYGPVLVLALGRVASDWDVKKCLDSGVGFLLTFAVISFLLAKHELIYPAFQPLHFTRGYIWTPLCLIALPYIQRGLIVLQANVPSYLFACLAVVLAGVVVSDNATFIATYGSKELGEYLTPDQRQVYREMNDLGIAGTLLTTDPQLGYLSATYTAAQPYLGHQFLTPDFRERIDQVGRWMGGEQEPWFDTIEYILVEPENLPADFDRSVWRTIPLENQKYILLQRK